MHFGDFYSFGSEVSSTCFLHVYFKIFCFCFFVCFSEYSCVLSPGNSWIELILSEIHDFSRAVDGLVKEIYLGMIFLSLQVITC